MSILNVLLRPDRLLGAVDTLAEDARTGVPSAGAKVLLVPQHNLLLATRGSAQFSLQMYQILLQASYRATFQIEQAMAELGAAIDQQWPSYEAAAAASGIELSALGAELVLSGWSPTQGRMVATAYVKHTSSRPAITQPLEGGLASPGEPLKGRADSFDPADLIEAARLQATYLNAQVGRIVASGRLLAADLTVGRATLSELGTI